MDPTQNISQIISCCIHASIETAGSSEEKTVALTKRLLENQHSFLREPLKKSPWKKVCRFFRNTFRSKETCQYKDLKDNLASIRDILSQSGAQGIEQSVTYSINKEQYKKLDILFDGDARKALLLFTEKLYYAVQNSSHSAELQKLITDVQRVIPKEVLACKQSQKALYLEAKKIAAELATTETLSLIEIEEQQKKITTIRQKISEEDFPIIQELERATAKLFMLKNKQLYDQKLQKAKQKIEVLNIQALLAQAPLITSELAENQEIKDLILKKIDALIDSFEQDASLKITSFQTDITSHSTVLADIQAALSSIQCQILSTDDIFAFHYKTRIEKAELHITQQYFQTLHALVKDEWSKALSSTDSKLLIRHKQHCQSIQATIALYEHQNSNAFQEHPSPMAAEVLQWQKIINQEAAAQIQEADRRISELLEQEKGTIQEQIAALPAPETVKTTIGKIPHTVSNLTELANSQSLTSWAAGVVLSTTGYHLGIADTLSDTFQVSSTSATAIAITAATATAVVQALSQGLPLSYAAGYAATTILLPTLASGISIYGVSIGPVAGLATIYLVKQPLLETISIHYKTAWMSDWGVPGSGLHWLITGGSSAWYFGTHAGSKLI